jgi:tetratricopeptide (TPR) repeat protein
MAGASLALHDLERDARLSDSVLWELNRRAYAEMDRDAWSEGVVPSQVSANPQLGRHFAELAVAFWLGAARERPLDPAEPLYLIDLCSGSGRLGLYLALELERLRPLLGEALPPVVVVLTDFQPSFPASMRSVPKLASLAEAGRVDFASFDAADPQPLRLDRSGAVLERGALANPIVVTASYALDSLPCDAFRCSDGRLFELLVRTQVGGGPPGARSARELIEDLELSTRAVAAQRPRYVDAELEALLEAYLRDGRVAGGDWLLPTTGIRALRALRETSSGAGLLLCGDKAYRFVEELAASEDVHVAKHGSLSVMVNLHAVGTWAEQRGGRAHHSARFGASFTASAFLLPGEGRTLREEVAGPLAVRFRALDDSPPADAWRAAEKLVEADAAVEELVRALRLSGYDPWIFRRCRASLKRKLREASPGEQQDAAQALLRVWENHFRLRADDDVAFDIGCCFFNMQRMAEARRFFEHSVAEEDEHAATFCNLGECEAALGNRAAAERALRRSIALDPDFARAREVLEELGAVR